jgi:hypothetical protein
MRLAALERGRQGDHRQLFIGRDGVQFYFPFFLISEINFGLQIIPENPEIIIKSQKILRKLRKIQEIY